jgi:hypothetical protein
MSSSAKKDYTVYVTWPSDLIKHVAEGEMT